MSICYPTIYDITMLALVSYMTILIEWKHPVYPDGILNARKNFIPVGIYERPNNDYYLCNQQIIQFSFKLCPFSQCPTCIMLLMRRCVLCVIIVYSMFRSLLCICMICLIHCLYYIPLN
jgi:hypothetical protein